jgi:hypothetical protein
MSEATMFTVAILSLLAVFGSLTAFLGWILGKRRVDDEISRAWSDGFNNAAGYEGKLEKLAKRRRWFGR